MEGKAIRIPSEDGGRLDIRLIEVLSLLPRLCEVFRSRSHHKEQ
jgi:hypothetical protein